MTVKTTSTKTTRSRIFPAPGWVLLALLPCIFSQLRAASLTLEKTQDFYVRDFSPDSPPTSSHGFYTWRQVKTGYMLGTPTRLYFYTPSLEPSHSFEISGLGSGNLFIDDTVIYQLDPTKWAITQYDLDGNVLRRWVYPSYHYKLSFLAVAQGKIVIAGNTWKDIEIKYYTEPYPVIRIYDTLTCEPPVEIDRFIKEERLDYINQVKKAGDFLATNLIPFEDGFLAVNAAEPYVFFFSSSGKLQWTIKDIPEGYRSISDAPEWSTEEYKKDPAFFYEWSSHWDNTRAGITIIQDSLLVVPRNTTNHPVYLDIYNLADRSFLTRLEAPGRVAGASYDRLFFIDTISDNMVKISAWRFDNGMVPVPNTDSVEIAVPDESQCCSGKSGCCTATNPFGHVQCAPEKLHVVDTIQAGKDRIARVVCNYALTPDSLFQFCHPEKKTMFVFVAPTHEISNKLLDTLAYHLKGKKDWILTTVVCYPAPPDLSFYLPDLKGDQMLVNRCVSIPDTTLAFADIPQPPIALALSEGGREVITGYSLSPSFDALKQQKNMGIIFSDFLKKCGITEE